MYKGTLLTLMRDVPGSIAWFGTYEIIKRELVKFQGIEDPSKLSPLAVMVAGGFAGMACWGVCVPPDTLKSRYVGWILCVVCQCSVCLSKSLIVSNKKKVPNCT